MAEGMQIAHFSSMNISFIKEKCATQITYLLPMPS